MEGITEILIDGHKYICISSERYTAENTVPEHTLEDGSNTADHIIIGTPTFDLTLKLFDEEWEILNNLQQQQALFNVVMPQGVYDNVALKKLSDTYGASANTTLCNAVLEVLRLTNTETRITELDGLVAAPIDTTGQQTTSIVEDTKDVTVNQLKEYYLNEIRATKGWWAADAEEAKMSGMPTDELINYLIDTQKNVELIGYLEALQYDRGEERQTIDLPEKTFDAQVGALGESITFTLYDSTNKPTTYTLTIICNKSMMTWNIINEISNIFKETQYHAKITRKADKAIMYNGTLTDLTPFCMIDPVTYIKVAVLQASFHLKKLYITTNVTAAQRAAANGA